MLMIETTISVPLVFPYVGEEEIAAVTAVLRSGQLAHSKRRRWGAVVSSEPGSWLPAAGIHPSLVRRPMDQWCRSQACEFVAKMDKSGKASQD